MFRIKQEKTREYLINTALDMLHGITKIVCSQCNVFTVQQETVVTTRAIHVSYL